LRRPNLSARFLRALTVAVDGVDVPTFMPDAGTLSLRASDLRRRTCLRQQLACQVRIICRV
jgi:hypothetical protein